MGKRVSGPLIGALPETTEAADLALHLQLYYRLRDGIVSGALPAGARLPSSRTLAADLGLSRNTVETALMQLRAEGFVTRRVGSGSYVAPAGSRSLVGQLGQRMRRRAEAGAADEPTAPRSALSSRGRFMSKWTDDAAPAAGRAFVMEAPALDDFPLEQWNRVLARRARRGGRALLGHADPTGLPALREAIAAHLASSRGVRCDSGQVVVLASTQQALDLCARLLLDPGDHVLIEDPGYLGARAAFRNAGAHLVPVPVDEQGIDAEWLGATDLRAGLVYVTPSHQYPLGPTLSLQRRLGLLRWAERSGAWVFEDDYDSEFHHAGRPIAAIQGLDRAHRVLYAGTLNKLLFPGLRLAYLVLPEALVGAVASGLGATAGPPAAVLQAAAADFMVQGHLASHVRTMRARYRERREALLESLERELGTEFHIVASDTGLHLSGYLPSGIDDVAVSARAAACGLDVPPLSRHFLRRDPRHGLLINFAGVGPGRIRWGIRILADCVGRARLPVAP